MERTKTNVKKKALKKLASRGHGQLRTTRNAKPERSPDFYSSIFAENSNEEDDDISNKPQITNKNCKLRTKSKTSLKSVDKITNSTAPPERACSSNILNQNEKGKQLKSKSKVYSNVEMADSDSSDNSKGDGERQGFEYDDDDSDDCSESEPEIIGFGMRSTNHINSIPNMDEDLEIKQEVKSESPDSEEESKPNGQFLRAEASSSNWTVETKAEEGDEEVDRTAIRKELADLSYEELGALKQKLGIKMFDEAMFGKAKGSKRPLSKKKQMQIFKRDNKNRPRELSSKGHVPKVREVIHVKKIVKRDPRFEDSCGELNKELWDKNYEFLKEIQEEEVKEMQKSLKKEQNDERRTEIKKYIQTFKNKEKSTAQKEKELQKIRIAKEENMKRMADGRNPFYLKKSTKKFLDLADKYEELKSSGKLEKYLKKKRKKNLVRDKKVVALGSNH